jgi:hypothetical protein
MLFVLIMEVLNWLFCLADSQGFLRSLVHHTIKCRATFYTDDLVLFITPRQDDLLVLKEILRMFREGSGLFTNLEKSVATPIHCIVEQMNLVQLFYSAGLVISLAGIWKSHYLSTS